jgi:type IV pilus assembly protein PilP
MKEFPIKSIGITAVLLVLAGCANPDLGDLHRFVDEQKARTPGRIEPIPEIKQIETFIYEDRGRRDPFAPMQEQASKEVAVADNGIQPDRSRRKEELELFALDSLRMVGILEQAGVMWGLVKTKEGTIHRVKNGNYMGRNHGRILQVSEDKITLNEIIQDGSGGYSERQASLAMTE